jgi:ATP-dependent helicase HrpA
MDPTRDLQHLRDVEWVQGEYEERLREVPSGVEPPDELKQVRWMIEELRVSYFAQTLGTAYSISPQRIIRVLDTID